MNIALERYRTFLAVADCASISLASERLCVSQPAVSQSIRLLEQELGCQLFARGAKGVTLTGEGEALLPYVRQAMTLLERAEQHFDELKTLDTGTLRIGASDSLCKHWLLPRLSNFHRMHPGISIQVTNRTSTETMELLHTAKVDIGLVNLPMEIRDKFVLHEIQAVQDCFVYHADAFPSLPAALPMAELARLPLLMLERASSSRRYIDACFSQEGVTLAPQIELGSLDLLAEFAKAGLGICAVVAQFVQAELGSGALKRLDPIPPLPMRGVGMVYSRDLPLPFSAKAFLQENMD